ncbi:hypothetical protein TCON_2358 [Astathelohania contejeani]|uniref:Uncharacterized protein n=1 Tax=Astathelohania contejeani TaxID=164912 RepID=A0ABQ7HW79_9MICR|nr:hypothetical protein TCON_2358 [Thelohania contejeani]
MTKWNDTILYKANNTTNIRGCKADCSCFIDKDADKILMKQLLAPITKVNTIKKKTIKHCKTCLDKHQCFNISNFPLCYCAYKIFLDDIIDCERFSNQILLSIVKSNDKVKRKKITKTKSKGKFKE